MTDRNRELPPGYLVRIMARHHATEQPDGDGQRPASRAPDPHRTTVVVAEVRRLQRRLQSIGPMHRDRLAQDCGADRWREGTFEEAIREGVRLGMLRQLPLGWVEAASGDAPSPPR